jgi:hypothetical protein
MGYNRLNKLLRDKKVIEIVNEHYRAGYTTYAGIYRKYVLPIYPMSYHTFIDIMSIRGIDTQIENEKKKLNK